MQYNAIAFLFIKIIIANCPFLLRKKVIGTDNFDQYLKKWILKIFLVYRINVSDTVKIISAITGDNRYN